jgi:hypothetical protein
MATAALQSQTLQTVGGRVKMAMDTINQLGGETGDSVYLGIGHGYPWSANDTQIPQPLNTTDYLNQVHRDLVALKLLSVSSASLVVQRSDWTNGMVYSKFSESANMYSYDTYTQITGTANVANSNIITGTLSYFTVQVEVGDFISINGDGIYTLPVIKEVVAIANDQSMTVNSNISGNYVSTTIDVITNSYPSYANTFYCRNIYDQVFVCLDNNNGIASNSMPAISIGGALPTDPYIITNDNYKWKYLYTMSSGQKKLFLTNSWMPVGTDAQVTGSAVDGRIDVIDITNGGIGYNSNTAACNAPILLLTGDGTGANVSAQVDSNGTIFFVNVFDAGEGYTQATLTANSGANGKYASFNVNIGPRGGWGSNAALELGATTLMVSTTLSDTENGTIPTEDVVGEFFTYRQLSLILNPTLYANSGNVATNTNYDMTTAIQISNPATVFRMGDIAYQNQTGTGVLANATFFGTIVWYDGSGQILHLNNIGGTGSFVEGQPISAVTYGAATNAAPYSIATAFQLTEPEVNTFSGVDLYIENTAPIQRYPLQTEEVRLILSF